MKKEKVLKVAIIIGVILIPLMYSFFYLKAFWDPYGNLKDIRIALVNNDIGNEEKNLGNKLTQSLIDKDVMTFDVVDENVAKDGLVNGDYYALISIPSDFTSNLSSAATKDRKTTTITYSPNQKSSYLASQIINKVVTAMEEELQAQVTKEVINILTDKLNEVPSSLQTISEAAGTINDGVSSLNNGLNTIGNSTTTLSSSYNEFNNGISSALNGSKTLNTGINTVSEGILDIYNGSITLSNSTKDLPKITSSTSELAKASNTLSTGIGSYVETVNSNFSNILDTIINTTTDPKTKAIVMGIKNSADYQKLLATGNTLNVKVNEFNTNMQNLKSATTSLPKVSDATKTLSNSLAKLNSGISQVSVGSNNLVTGLNTLSVSSAKIKDGINLLDNGVKTAINGSNTLFNGTTTFKNTIDENIFNTSEKLKDLDGLEEYTNNAFEVIEDDYGKVESYGVGFAPYFISVSLWVGNLMLLIALYYDPDDRFKLLGRNAKNKLVRYLGYALVAISQAIVLGIVLKVGLGFSVTNMSLYFGTCMLISLVFLSIIQFLIVNFGDVGKFLGILFLVLQLSACGGTFPIETVPIFFQKIYSFMPMTYTVKLLKEALILQDVGVAGRNILILVSIFVTFVGITIILDLIRKIHSNGCKEKVEN